jgi:hypothetical protein
VKEKEIEAALVLRGWLYDMWTRACRENNERQRHAISQVLVTQYLMLTKWWRDNADTRTKNRGN